MGGGGVEGWRDVAFIWRRGAKLEMWHDPPPPGTESISLPGGAAKRLGDGVSKGGSGGGGG